MDGARQGVRIRDKSTGREVVVPAGSLLKDVVKQFETEATGPILAVKCNNDLLELTRTVERDCDIDFIDLRCDDGQRIYQRSLVMVLVKAVRDLFPGAQVTIEHSLSNGLYGEIHHTTPIGEQEIEMIAGRMQEIIAADLPFCRETVSKEEAMEFFRGAGQEDKVQVLKYRQTETVHLYTLDNVKDYFYGYMVPSTGYLKLFRLLYYFPGFILQIPSKYNPHSIPPYCEQPKLAAIFREAERWGRIEQISYVGSLNEKIEKGEIGDLIRLAEVLHENKIAKIAEMIVENLDTIRIVLIAGPSSSGKTTFAQRLSLHLRVHGLQPVAISLDDYFVDRELTPRDESGNYDFESIEAIDLELFNRDLACLLQGKEVEIPVFDFREGKRKYTGRKLRITPEQPIILEGIHCLNDRLTHSIPSANKFKIYISCLTHLNLDAHNRIPTTDVRKLRRICRDYQFRNHGAEDTLRMWDSVRRGEERNIFPFQENADVMFNSSLAYELAVLKPVVEPLLLSIGPSSDQYSEAKRLLAFLSYFLPLEDDEVPATSILREFIGGSPFA